MQGSRAVGVRWVPWAVVCLSFMLLLTATWRVAPSRAGTPQASRQSVGVPIASAVPGIAPVQPTPTPEYALGGRVLTTIATGRHLRNADLSIDSLGRIAISFELTDEGTRIFRDFTVTHVGETVAVVLDKRVVSAALIQNPITDGKGILSGNFSMDSARDTVAKMKYGALPGPFKVIEVRPVGPTLLYQLFEALLRALQLRETSPAYTALEVLLEADLPPGASHDPLFVETARHILEKRANYLGVAGVMVRTLESGQLAIELPGVRTQSKRIMDSLCAPGLLEFVAAGHDRISPGQLVRTSLDVPVSAQGPPTPTPTRNRPGCG